MLAAHQLVLAAHQLVKLLDIVMHAVVLGVLRLAPASPLGQALVLVGLHLQEQVVVGELPLGQALVLLGLHREEPVVPLHHLVLVVLHHLQHSWPKIL